MSYNTLPGLSPTFSDIYAHAGHTTAMKILDWYEGHEQQTSPLSISGVKGEQVPLEFGNLGQLYFTGKVVDGMTPAQLVESNRSQDLVDFLTK